MNITLSPELENAVRRKIASGEYGGVNDLIGEAIQR
jgi:Arc/MetJ-type ribon-helix-helix transcriptional regulator